MSALRVEVSDLLTHPRSRRPLHVSAAVEGLSGRTATVDGDVTVDVILERIPDGIIVRGTISAEWVSECGTCLRPIRQRLELAVAELFESAPVEGETYPIEGHEIDLEQLVRDTVLLELPLAPVCTGAQAADCEPAVGDGPEPSGATAPAGAPVDPRWSPLSQLRL